MRTSTARFSIVLHSNTSSSDTDNNPKKLPIVQSQQAFLKQSNSTRVNSESSATFRVLGGFQSIFGAQILGGTFHVHVHQNNNNNEQKSPARKHLRIAETESDTE